MSDNIIYNYFVRQILGPKKMNVWKSFILNPSSFEIKIKQQAYRYANYSGFDRVFF